MFRAFLTVLAIAAVAGGPSPAHAEVAPFRDPLVDKLVGRWVLRGTMAGRGDVVHDVVGQWVLGHQYLLLRETSRELRRGTVNPVYEAHIYIGWDQPRGRYGAIWLDASGEASSSVLGSAQPMINALPFVFTASDGTITRTTMTYDNGSRRWRWQIIREKDGQTVTLADLELVRAPTSSASPSGPAPESDPQAASGAAAR